MAEALRAAAGALALLLLLPAAAARAQDDQARALVGKWELAQSGAPRKCVLTLALESAAQGRQLRFPATCRRALPVLNTVAAWAAGEGGLPRLLDAAGKPILVFRRAAAGAAAEATSPDGQRYTLLREGQPARAARAPTPAESTATAATRPTVVDPARAPAAESLPGRYVVMRQPGREACRLTLRAAAAAGDQAQAAFEGRCDDVGLTIFDPVAWRYAGGRLTLVARRGHSVDLVAEGELWRKDPAVGAPMLLKRLGP